MHKVYSLLPEALHSLCAQPGQLGALCGTGLRGLISTLAVQTQAHRFFLYRERNAAPADRHRFLRKPKRMRPAHPGQKLNHCRLLGIQLDALLPLPENTCSGSGKLLIL